MADNLIKETHTANLVSSNLYMDLVNADAESDMANVRDFLDEHMLKYSQNDIRSVQKRKYQNVSQLSQMQTIEGLIIRVEYQQNQIL